MFSVTINAEIGSVEKVEAGTQYEDSDELYKGQSEVKSEGSDGDQIVTNEITSVNGAVLTSQVSDTALLNESVDTVVYKGTKERPKDTVRADYGGQVMEAAAVPLWPISHYSSWGIHISMAVQVLLTVLIVPDSYRAYTPSSVYRFLDGGTSVQLR